MVTDAPISKPVTPSAAALVPTYDLAELAVVLVVYLGLVARIVEQSWTNSSLTNLLLLPSEGLVVFFLLFRRPTQKISHNMKEWLLALSATLAPLLVEPGTGRSLVPPFLAAGVLLMGLILQIHAKVTLGRSFGCVPAHRGLQLAGPYRFVRHPMYAGYLLSHVAFLLVNPAWRNVVAYGVCYALQIPRLIAEERLLDADPKYRQYRQDVRFRLIPGVF